MNHIRTVQSTSKAALLSRLGFLRGRGRSISILLVPLALFAVAGCGSSDSSDDNSDSNSKSAKEEQAATKETKANGKSAAELYGTETLELGQSIAELRGHYIAAKELYGEHNYKEAKVHADHPVDELYSSFRQAVAERDPELDREIKKSLDRAVKLLDKRVPAAQFNEVVDRTASELMDRVVQVAAPEVDPKDPVFQAATAAGVVSTAGSEYTAAVPKGKVRLLAEYQDSYGFVNYCRLVVDGLENEVGSAKVAPVKAQLAELDKLAYSSKSKAPKQPVAATEVRAATADVAKGIEQALGRSLLLANTDVQVELRELASKLDGSVKLYSDGKTQETRDLLSKAYIDNFEDLEGDIAKEDPELMEQVEQAIAVEVPDLVKAKAAPSAVQKKVDQIKRLLPEVEKALGGEGDSVY